MRLSQGLWNSNAENADEVVWFVHTDRFQGFHSYDHYLQFWLDKRSLLRWYKTAYRFWENKKETAEIASRCCKNYSLTLQESGETPCLEVKCDFEHTLHFTLDFSSFSPLQPFLCQTFYTLIEYGKTTMFLWMFIEGIILHHMTTVAYSRGPDNQQTFYLCGWRKFLSISIYHWQFIRLPWVNVVSTDHA